jgi:hypothetical protein
MSRCLLSNMGAPARAYNHHPGRCFKHKSTSSRKFQRRENLGRTNESFLRLHFQTLVKPPCILLLVISLNVISRKILRFIFVLQLAFQNELLPVTSNEAVNVSRDLGPLK